MSGLRAYYPSASGSQHGVLQSYKKVSASPSNGQQDQDAQLDALQSVEGLPVAQPHLK